MAFNVKKFLEELNTNNSGQAEFLQVVEEVAYSLEDFLNDNPKYIEHKILERMIEPERAVSFRVAWMDDNNEIQVNRGYRVQFSSVLGPYKGGLRFHESVNLSIVKFLGFEQILKNSLTGLMLGGGKGGSNFDPKGKSKNEIMRFCQSFMNELYRHIGSETDVPAGDIGVSSEEVGFMFGQYKKLSNTFNGVLTGKPANSAGSNIRTEATGYGVVYFAEEMMKHKNQSLKGKKVLVSGSGNVAQYTIEKAIHLGAKVITVSDSDGVVYDKNGLDLEKLEFIKELKNNRKERIKELADKFKLEYLDGKTPWSFQADVALPCATQNEILEKDAKELIKNKVQIVVEGSNMSCNLDAIKAFQKAKVLYSPGKASNAGGVAVSGLEMAQNSQRELWTRDQVDKRLQSIMQGIHEKCLVYGSEKNYVDYVKGSNVFGFKRVADAMLEQGLV